MRKSKQTCGLMGPIGPMGYRYYTDQWVLSSRPDTASVPNDMRTSTDFTLILQDSHPQRARRMGWDEVG